MKLDISLLKTQVKEQSFRLGRILGRTTQNQNNLLNKLGFTVLSFVFLYNIFAHIYGYAFFTYSLREYINHFFLLVFFSFILGFFVLNNIFSMIVLTIGEQLLNLISIILKKFK